MMRQDWIDMKDDLAITRQCELAGVSRATIYARQRPAVADEDDLLLSRLIDEEYTRHPFYGSRRMVVSLALALALALAFAFAPVRTTDFLLPRKDSPVKLKR